MIRLTPSTPVRVAVAPIDFRRQIDGLAAHCRQALSTDPMSGSWFVFINRAHTMIRVLVYDGTGFWLMTKRLSRGRFEGWTTAADALSPMAARTLMQVLQAQGAGSGRGGRRSACILNGRSLSSAPDAGADSTRMSD